MFNESDFEIEKLGNDEVNGTVISTVKLPKVMRREFAFETAIFPPNENSEVVAKYKTREGALIGHQKWVKKIKDKKE